MRRNSVWCLEIFCFVGLLHSSHKSIKNTAKTGRKIHFCPWIFGLHKLYTDLDLALQKSGKLVFGWFTWICSSVYLFFLNFAINQIFLISLTKKVMQMTQSSNLYESSYLLTRSRVSCSFLSFHFGFDLP